MQESEFSNPVQEQQKYEEVMQALNKDAIMVDPLREQYASIVQTPQHRTDIEEHKVALLCIDMQYLDAARDCGVFADAESSGVPPEAQEYYFNRLDETVFPNVRRLQDAFRAQNLEVIHIRIQALTKDGRDRSRGHKKLKLLAQPNSKEAEFIEAIAPMNDEIIINKTASGVFTSTNLNYVLKNMGIQSLFATGVYTNECVDTTVRDACDLGYNVTVIEDCCATVTQELQDFTIYTLKDRYARVINTDEAIAEIQSLLEPANRTTPGASSTA